MPTDTSPRDTVPRMTDIEHEASRLRLVVARLQRLIRQHGTNGLNLAEGSCLAVIDRHGPLSLTEIASRENLSAPSVTKIVARLEHQKLIERLSDPTDRRVSLITTSKAGAGLLSSNRAERTAYLNERLSELAPDDLDLLLAALPVMETLASEHDRRESG